MRRVDAPTRTDIDVVSWDAKRAKVKLNPLAAWTDDDVDDLRRGQRRSAQPAAPDRLRLDRVRALHESHRPWRGPAGRPLVGAGQDRVRVAHMSPSTLVPSHPTLAVDHLSTLESEAIHIMREVAGEFERPALLFSGGKDSVVMLHLAIKAFHPARVPFPLLHVDTGHNFPEVIDYRDETVARTATRLVVARVQDWIDRGVLRDRPDGTRNPLQTVPLLDTITEHRFDAVFGGGRRDEEKARAKERIFSLRDEFGQWDPRRQRPELWDLYNGRHAPGEHVRVFPLSNWTELDVWRYIDREGIELPSIYFAHEREVFQRDGMWLTAGEWGGPRPGETVEVRRVRYRTVGDMSCTGAVDSEASDGRRGDRGGLGQPADRARRDPRRRPAERGGDGGPQAGGVLLMARELLRLATAGSVDDGKSTLVGRLLYDTKSILADTMDAIEQASRDRGLAGPDLALLTDGLRAEREQGITIDVAYRYFATPSGRSSSPTPRGTCSTPATW